MKNALLTIAACAALVFAVAAALPAEAGPTPTPERHTNKATFTNLNVEPVASYTWDFPALSQRLAQHYEKKSAKAFNKAVDPAMVGPSTLNGANISLLPGDVTYVDTMNAGTQFKPAHEILPMVLPAFEEKIGSTSRRINAGYYADLWLQMSQLEGQMTAREVAERHEEKMLQLGPGP